MTCIYLIQDSLLQRGKKTKIDIAKIAEMALQRKFKSRKEYVYIYKDIVYPYFNCYDIDATIYQIKKDKNDASGIATTNLLGLLGLSLDLTEQLKQLYPKSPTVPQFFATSSLSALPQEVQCDYNPPPIVVADREGDAFHSLLIGRKTKISFHRTLRVPEDGKDYPLPAGLGAFPIHRVEDYADTVPSRWLDEGGFFIPLYQREALFIQFEGEEWCPTIAKVCAGQINAITGKPYSEKLSGHSQDYVVIPKQQWLDGINSGDGTVNQFVAMPLGQGYTVEAQITDEEKYGGFQLVVYEPVDGRFAEPDYPIGNKIDFLQRICTSVFESMREELSKPQRAVVDFIRHRSTATGASYRTGLSKDEVIAIYIKFRESFFAAVVFNTKRHFSKDKDYQTILFLTFQRIEALGLREDIDPAPEIPREFPSFRLASSPAPEREERGSCLYSSPGPEFDDESSEIEEMGIAAGGKIKQQIFQDTYGIESWDFNRRRVLRIHMVNSIAYKFITGYDPPSSPVSVEQYQKAKIPWFSHYDETAQSVKSAGIFSKILGVGAIDKRRGVTNAPPIPKIQINPEVMRRIKTPDLREAIQAFRQRANANADAGRWIAAHREINYLIDLETGIEATDYVLRSSCNYQMKRYLEGLFDGDKALDLDPNCSSALSSRAFCRLALGDIHGVREDAEQLLRTPETELTGLELRAEASLLSGHYNDAIYDALSLGKRRPGYHRAEEILLEARNKAHQQFHENR